MQLCLSKVEEYERMVKEYEAKDIVINYCYYDYEVLNKVNNLIKNSNENVNFKFLTVMRMYRQVLHNYNNVSKFIVRYDPEVNVAIQDMTNRVKTCVKDLVNTIDKLIDHYSLDPYNIILYIHANADKMEKQYESLSNNIKIKDTMFFKYMRRKLYLLGCRYLV